MKQKIRISNSSDNLKKVCLEPLGEERSIFPGQEIHIGVEFLSEKLSVSDILEFSISDSSITVFYTAQAIADWRDSEE